MGILRLYSVYVVWLLVWDAVPFSPKRAPHPHRPKAPVPSWVLFTAIRLKLAAILRPSRLIKAFSFTAKFWSGAGRFAARGNSSGYRPKLHAEVVLRIFFSLYPIGFLIPRLQHQSNNITPAMM